MSAEVKISEMDSASALSGSEILEVVQSGENKKLALEDIGRLADDFEANNFICTSDAPGVSAGAGAGTGPTVSIVGNNEAGVVTVTTGTSAASGTLFRITLNNLTYKNSAIGIVQPQETDATAIQPDVFVTGTTTTIEVRLKNAPSDTTEYKFNYIIKGY